MAIVTLSQVKDYVKISASTTQDDALIDRLITAAQTAIESYTRRRFEPTTATKLYDERATRGDTLFLDDDLLSVTSLVDGMGRTLTPSDYRLEPRNHPPYSMVRALETVGETWVFDVDGEVAITGTWGWSATPPSDVVQATIRLTAWLYRQRDTSADQDRPIASDSGMLIMPSAMPKDIMQMIAPYRRPNR